MAVIRLGELVTGIRGTVGASTYSANGAGAYVKPWSRPGVSRTAPQMARSSDLVTVNEWWRDLTDSERADWNTWAASPPETLLNSLGEPYTLSGFGWFKKLVLRQLYFTDTPILTATTVTTRHWDPWDAFWGAAAGDIWLDFGPYVAFEVGDVFWGFAAWRSTPGASVLTRRFLQVAGVIDLVLERVNVGDGLRAVYPDLAAGDTVTIQAGVQGETGVRWDLGTKTAVLT